MPYEPNRCNKCHTKFLVLVRKQPSMYLSQFLESIDTSSTTLPQLYTSTPLHMDGLQGKSRLQKGRQREKRMLTGN